MPTKQISSLIAYHPYVHNDNDQQYQQVFMCYNRKIHQKTEYTCFTKQDGHKNKLTKIKSGLTKKLQTMFLYTGL